MLTSLKRYPITPRAGPGTETCGMAIFSRPSCLLWVAALLAGLCGSALAQGVDRTPTGALSPAPPAAPEWSGESGSSGHPLMSADAIRAAAANFRNCLKSLWPAAARRGIARATFDAQTAAL